MRIVCISDTHEEHDKLLIPPCDLLIHAGDITYTGNFFVLNHFFNWLREQPARGKIVIPGNHDLSFEDPNNLAHRLINTDIDKNNDFHFLIHNQITIEGMTVFGSPYTPRFYDWAFNVDRDKIEAYWHQIPDNTHILITHGPPYGILDKNSKGEHVGDKALLDRIKQLKELRLVVFGHIHESAGTTVIDNVIYVNACSMNKNYVITHNPVIITL